jgi:hypothetical protein
MKTEIIRKDKKSILIAWAKEGVGFGQLEMKWHQHQQRFSVNSENMGIDHVIEVFKAL